MKVPPINAPLEMAEFLNWVKRELLARVESDRVQDGYLDSIRAQLGMTAGSATDTNVQVEQSRLDIIELWAREVLPDGGGPGADLRKDRESKPAWFPNLAGGLPTLYVTMEAGASYFSWGDFSWAAAGDSAEPGAMPEVEFFDDGLTMGAVVWPGAGESFPINYDIEVIPSFDGETFSVFIPGDGYGFGGMQAPQVTVTIYNRTAFTANVQVGNNDAANDRLIAYADSGINPWDTRPVPGNPDFMVNMVLLRPQERLAWLMLWADYRNRVMPVVQNYEDASGRRVTGPADFFYWRHVWSRRRSKEWCAVGALEVVAAGVSYVIDGPDPVRIGLIRATTTTAPTGSGIEVDVSVNGVPVTVSPVTIPASQRTVAVEPDAFTHGPSGSATGMDGWTIRDSVIAFPGDEITVAVPAVGSTTPGTDLTVQVFFG